MKEILKPSDLRIGNLIQDGHDIEAISVRHLQMMVEGQAEFDPIPLTEESLLRLGFEYYKSNNSHQLDTPFGVSFWGRNGIINTYCESDECGNEMTYVHEVQNRYYSLSSGQELEFKI